MLVIRNEQMAMLEQFRLEERVADISPIMREAHTRVFKYYSDAQLQVWIKNQLVYLKTFGFCTERAIYRGLHILAIFGENFERCKNPEWALSILNSTLNPDAKALMLTYEGIKELEKKS